MPTSDREIVVTPEMVLAMRMTCTALFSEEHQACAAEAYRRARALEPAPAGEWTREPIGDHPVADLWYWMRNIDSPHERWVGRGIDTYDHPYGWERWSLPLHLPPAPTTDEVK